MPNYFVNLPAPEVRNALVDFAPLNNGLDSIRQQGNTNRNALMQQKQMDAKAAERTYQHGRDQQADHAAKIKRGGAMATAIQNMDDRDPAKAVAWQQYLKEYGDGDHSPEELDFRMGPKIAAAQAGMYQDQLERQLKQAQINKLNREPTGGENPSNVREWEYYSKLPDDQKQHYLTMKRADKYLDTGTQFLQPNPVVPGANVRAIDKNVAEAASLKEQGETQGKAAADLPRQMDNADLALKTINDIRTHPGKKWGVGAAGVVPGVPGTAQRGFVNLVDQAKGQTFLQAFNSLRGGGQITEAEGNKATQALGRLDRAQSQSDFDAALSDLESVIKAGRARAQSSATRAPSAAPGQAPQGASPPVISSPEDAMKLPPGTVFMTPDGRTKVRP